MAENLTFYTNPMSRGRIVRWMLEEVGAPYTTHIIEYGADMKSETYRALNPMGKVPTVVHGDKVISECAGICAYLADAFPQASLAPPPANRADYYRWLFFTAGPVEAALTDKTRETLPQGDDKARVGYGCYEDVLHTLEQAVTGKTYIAGDSFSAADVYVGAQISFGLMFETLPPLPAFQQYWTNLSKRDAYRRATELDDAIQS